MANYPGSLPSTTPATHTAVNNEIVAIATALGTNPQGVYATVAARCAAALLAANNLSDLTDAPTARANLGLTALLAAKVRTVPTGTSGYASEPDGTLWVEYTP